VSFLNRKPRTRAEVVAAADRHRARGRFRKAVVGYREALASDPTDPSVNVKLGPLLARLGDADGGVRCFRVAAERHLSAGFVDRAAAVCLAATGVFPLDAGFRAEVARLNLQRGRKADAVAALVSGGRALAGARQRPAAVSLLRRALDLAPAHLEASLALAPVLAAEGAREDAIVLLRAAERGARGRDLRRVRFALLRLAPSPGALFRWLGAVFGVGGARARPPHPGASAPATPARRVR
jgi:tetratricopeptide (TPR) repeat protein